MGERTNREENGAGAEGAGAGVVMPGGGGGGADGTNAGVKVIILDRYSKYLRTLTYVRKIDPS